MTVKEMFVFSAVPPAIDKLFISVESSTGQLTEIDCTGTLHL